MTASPLAAAPAFLPAAALRLLGAGGGSGREAAQAAGQHDLETLAADLDGDALALLGLVGLGAVAGVGLDLVVEVGLDPGRVDVERALAAGVGGADVRRVVDDRAVERDDGRHAVDDELGQRAAAALERLGAVAAGDDELGDQRVEGAGDRLAVLVPAVETYAGALRRLPRRQRAGRRHEVAAAVLGVDAELDGVAADRRVVVAELLAGRDAEHLADQVDAGDLLGDAVLDLEAGVDLEEGDGAVPGDEELAGAGADVPRLAQDRLAGLVEAADLVVGEERRGRLLDQLLVAALERAVAGGDDDDVAVLVGQALGLDVPRLVEELLDQALAAAERADRLADRRLVELGDLLQGAGDLEAAAAAAEDGLDGDRQAVLLRERDDLVGVLDRVLGAGGQGRVGLLRDVLGLGLVAEVLDRRRAAGPIQTRPASMTAWAKPAFSARKP